MDAVGWQAHVETGWDTEANLKELDKLIDWAHYNDLEFHVTEASVWIKDEDTPAARDEQARTYAAIVNAMLKKRSEGIVAWNTWHVSDSAGWNRHWKGSLFDRGFNPKPACFAIRKALESNRDETAFQSKRLDTRTRMQ